MTDITSKFTLITIRECGSDSLFRDDPGLSNLDFGDFQVSLSMLKV